MTAASEPSSPLVSTRWLAGRQHDPNVRIVDVRWRSRYESGRGVSVDDYEGYRAGHIPGAVFAGMNGDLSDPRHAIPDMLIQPEEFAQVMGRLGIGNDTLVVTYDNMGFPPWLSATVVGFILLWTRSGAGARWGTTRMASGRTAVV